MVILSGVEDKFLHVWLSYHEVKESELSLSSGGHGKGSHKCKYIGNKSLANRIKNDNKEFVAGGSNFENYFNRSVIEFRQTTSNRPFSTRIKKVEKSPVFIYKSQRAYCLRPNNRLKAWKPIQMSLKAIFSIYGIDHEFQDSTIEACLALQEPNSVDVNFYLLDNDKAYWAKSLPGFRESSNRIINIATHNNKFYWLPSSNLISQRKYCSILPGKCLFWTHTTQHLNDHEATCTDESIVRAKQVLFLILSVLIKSLRFDLVNQKIHLPNWSNVVFFLRVSGNFSKFTKRLGT